MSPAEVVKLTNTSITDVKTLHRQPALIQELTWWLPMIPGASYKADSVRELLFSFHNGELYKISATYDRGAIEGAHSGGSGAVDLGEVRPTDRSRDRN